MINSKQIPHWVVFPAMLVGMTAAAAPVNFLVAPEAETGLAPQRVAAGDVNGDGLIDVVTADIDLQEEGQPGHVSVLINNGNRTFAAPVRYPVGESPRAVELGDFNGDGYLDIAVTGSASDIVSVLINNGDGTFRPQRSYPAAHGAHDIAIADFNGDGALDLAVSGYNDYFVWILLNAGDGTFVPGGMVYNGAFCTVAAGDVNGDGRPDLVMADGASLGIKVALHIVQVPDAHALPRRRRVLGRCGARRLRSRRLFRHRDHRKRPVAVAQQRRRHVCSAGRLRRRHRLYTNARASHR